MGDFLVFESFYMKRRNLQWTKFLSKILKTGRMSQVTNTRKNWRGMQACFIKKGLRRLCSHCVCPNTFEQKRARLSTFQLPTTNYGCTRVERIVPIPFLSTTSGQARLHALHLQSLFCDSCSWYFPPLHEPKSGSLTVICSWLRFLCHRPPLK